MSAGTQPDYDALAQKYGSAQQPDYDALAQKYGADTPAQPSAGSRFLEGIKAGTGGENALNTPIDPQHPIASNPMIPGAGVYRDIKAGNYAGAAGRIAGPAAEILPMIMGGGGELGEPQPARPSSLGVKARALGNVAAKEAISHIPVAGRVVQRPSIGDYWKAITAKPEMPPVEIGAGSTDQLPGRPYMPNPRFRPQPESAAPIPARQGLALPAGEPAQPPVPVTRKQVGEAVDRSFGVEPLKPNVKLRDQMKAQPAAKAESSVIQSHKYVPEANELHITTKGNPNTTYVYGDVSPEQAQKFEGGASKGKSWAEFKKGSSPLVAKIVNGERTPVRPVIKGQDLNREGSPQVRISPRRNAVPTPDDLTPILKKSLKQVQARKSSAAAD